MHAALCNSESHGCHVLQVTEDGASLNFWDMAAELYLLRNMVHVGTWITDLHGQRLTCEYCFDQHGSLSNHVQQHYLWRLLWTAILRILTLSAD